MSKTKINSRFLGKKFGAWTVTGVRASDKYKKAGVSQSYAYTYTLTNAKAGKRITVTGYQMRCLADHVKTVKDVISGKKACLKRHFNVRANTIKSI